MQRPRSAMWTFGINRSARCRLDRRYGRGMIAMSMSDENMRDRFTADGIEQCSDMCRIVGARIDDGDFPAAEDVAHGSLERKWTGVVGHDSPHAGRWLIHRARRELEIFVEGNVGAHVPSDALAGTGLPLFRPSVHPGELQMTDVLSALIPAKWPARVVYWVLAGLHDRAVGQV